MTSARFTPAAATLISSSPEPTAGTPRSPMTSTSGSPGSVISITRIVLGISAITFTRIS